MQVGISRSALGHGIDLDERLGLLDGGLRLAPGAERFGADDGGLRDERRIRARAGGVPLLVQVERSTPGGTGTLQIELAPEPNAAARAILVCAALAFLARRGHQPPRHAKELS